MHNTLAIAKRQFSSYFNTPVAYIVICASLLVVGIFFWEPFFLQNAATMRSFWPILMLYMIIGAPALTMGLLADEKRTGTLEVLLTMPVRDHELVLGKFLAVVGLWGLMLALTLTYPVSIAALGDLDWGQALAGYLGLFLAVCGMLSFGLFASSITSSQMVALFLAVLYCLFTSFLFDKFLIYFSQGLLKDFFQLASFGTHLDSMARGVVSIRDVVYFAFMAIWPLSLAVLSIASRRWT